MKTVLIIGVGKFGTELCKNMIRMKNEVMAVDSNEEALEEVLTIATSAKVADCTKSGVLETFGVKNFDVCFVCVGDNFQSSLEITCRLKEMGAKLVISKANKDLQAKFLLRNGADKVIYPDRDMAEKMAIQYSADNVYDYIELSDDYSIYEIAPMKAWIGKTIRDINIRAKYQVNILAYKKGEETKLILNADYVCKEDEHLMIMGEESKLKPLIGR